MAFQDAIVQLYKTHQAGQEKYTYFLLAAAGAAIGLAVQKTEGLRLSWWLLPVALATVSWAASFVFGCKNVEWVHATISANMTLLQLRNGSHPEQPPHTQLAGAAIAGVGSAIHKNIEKAFFYGLWQFRFLTLGAGFFIAWRIAETVRISLPLSWSVCT